MNEIYEVKVNTKYKSSNNIFEVLGFCQHGQDCSIRMILYTNLTTTDYPPNTKWVLEESLFIKKFKELK